MMPRMPLLSLRSSNRMTHYPLCSSTVGGRGDQNLLGFNGTDAAVLYAASAAVAAIAEFGERPTPNAASAAANSRLTIEITPLEASKQQAPLMVSAQTVLRGAETVRALSVRWLRLPSRRVSVPP